MLNSTPLYSILLPAQGDSETLCLAVESALHQTLRDFELLVVGDRSGHTADVLPGLRDDRLRWHDLPQPRDPGHADFNAVLRQARGRLVAYMRQDNLWLPDHLERLADCFTRDEVDLAYSLPLWVTPEGHVTPTPFNLHDPDLRARFLAMRGSTLPIGCVAHRRRCLEELGYWNETLPGGGDMELWGRIIAAGQAGNFTYQRVPSCLNFLVKDRTDEGCIPAEVQRWLNHRMQLEPAGKTLRIDSGPGSSPQEAFWRKLQSDPAARSAQLRSAVVDILERRYQIMDERWGGTLASLRQAEAERWQYRGVLQRANVTPEPPQHGLAFGGGFYNDQGQGRWMRSCGAIHFTSLELPAEIRIACHGGPAEHYDKFPFRVDLEVDGDTRDSRQFHESDQRQQFVFQPESRNVTVRLQSESAFVPARAGMNRDQRALAIRVTAVEVGTPESADDESLETDLPPSHAARDGRDSVPTSGATVAVEEGTSPDTLPAESPQKVTPRRTPISPPSVDRPQDAAGEIDPRVHWTRFAEMAFSAFLTNGTSIQFPTCECPRVSVLLVLLNRCELTYLCLQSILANVRIPYEVIIVDNASEDQTGPLLNRLRGVQIARNSRNEGFVRAVNQAARLAHGDHLLLLNNDTCLTGDCLAVAADVLDGDPGVGAVGGRLVSPEGTLQAAGSEVRTDGTTRDYGGGESPLAPAFMQPRTVDFCSGAFLMTRSSDFRTMGGLDESYSPAYYEELDYCTRLAKRGLRVVYEPGVFLLHYESASSPPQHVEELMRRNRQKYYEKHKDWLQQR